MNNFLKYGLIPAFLSCGLPAFADDCESAIGVGGLELKKSQAISMEREDLFISTSQVRVSFDFRNNSPADYKTIVAFPIPAHSPKWSEAEGAEGPLEEEEGIRNLETEFSVTVNGKKQDFLEETKVSVHDWDVTDTFKEYSIDPQDADMAIQALKKSASAKQAFLAEGIIDKFDNGNVIPNWTLFDKYYWEQVFPAEEIIHIEHTYPPIVGSAYTGSKIMENDQQFQQYCIDQSVQNAINAKLEDGPKITGENLITYSLVDYILTSANTWIGPIKDFYLTIEKPDNSLASTCFDSLEKTEPRTLKAHKTDFKPDKELSIIFFNMK